MQLSFRRPCHGTARLFARAQIEELLACKEMRRRAGEMVLLNRLGCTARIAALAHILWCAGCLKHSARCICPPWIFPDTKHENAEHESAGNYTNRPDGASHCECIGASLFFPGASRAIQALRRAQSRARSLGHLTRDGQYSQIAYNCTGTP